MSSIITLTVQEAQDNFDFVFSLVERGHTIKLISESGHIVLMTPIATPNIIASKFLIGNATFVFSFIFISFFS